MLSDNEVEVQVLIHKFIITFTNAIILKYSLRRLLNNSIKMTQHANHKSLKVPRAASSTSLQTASKALLNDQVSLEWKKCFFIISSKIIPPCIERLLTIEEKNEQNIFSRFSLKSWEGDFPCIPVRSFFFLFSFEALKKKNLFNYQEFRC